MATSTTAKRGRPRKVPDGEEEGSIRRYRIEIGYGKEAKLVYDRWQALLSRFHKAGQIKLLTCALDAVERVQMRKRLVKNICVGQVLYS